MGARAQRLFCRRHSVANGAPRASPMHSGGGSTPAGSPSVTVAQSSSRRPLSVCRSLRRRSGIRSRHRRAASVSCSLLSWPRSRRQCSSASAARRRSTAVPGCGRSWTLGRATCRFGLPATSVTRSSAHAARHVHSARRRAPMLRLSTSSSGGSPRWTSSGPTATCRAPAPAGDWVRRLPRSAASFDQERTSCSTTCASTSAHATQISSSPVRERSMRRRSRARRPAPSSGTAKRWLFAGLRGTSTVGPGRPRGCRSRSPRRASRCDPSLATEPACASARAEVVLLCGEVAGGLLEDARPRRA
jgi:hypothetical protein